MRRCLIILLLFLAFTGGDAVFCNITMPNDGTAKTADQIYENSGVPPYFTSLPYYDVAIPYGVKVSEVGGWAKSGYYKEPGDSWTEETIPQYGDRRDLFIGQNYTYEFGSFSTARARGEKLYNMVMGWGLKTGDDNGICWVQLKDGTKAYLTAIQNYFYCNDTAGTGDFPEFNGNQNGQLVDAIFTNGSNVKVVHFVIVDANASQHSLGGDFNPDENPDFRYDKAQQVGSHADGSNWVMYGMKAGMEQYWNACGSFNMNCIEMWGSLDAFKSAVGVKEGYNLAYYRLYAAHAKDADASKLKSAGATKEAIYDAGACTIVASGNGVAPSAAQNAASVAGSGSSSYFEETHYVAKTGLAQPMYTFAERDLLSDEEIYNMELWKNDLDAKSESLPARILRWFAMLFGIVLIAWAAVFYLAYWFDRVNNLIQIDATRLITFGKLTVSPTEEECTFSVRELAKGECRTINHRKALEIVALCFVFAFLIISGTGFVWVRKFITFMLHVLGNTGGALWDSIRGR